MSLEEQVLLSVSSFVTIGILNILPGGLYMFSPKQEFFGITYLPHFARLL